MVNYLSPPTAKIALFRDLFRGRDDVYPRRFESRKTGKYGYQPAWLIAHRGVNTLILVHRRHLLEQWVDRLSAFLGLPVKAIGQIGGGRKKPTGALDVAIIQSLVRKGVVDDRVGEYGHLVVDECHRLSAPSFEQVARRAKAKFVTGLSATVTRKDGHHPIIFMQCGPVRHRVDAKEQALARPFAHTVRVRAISGGGCQQTAR